MKKDIYLITLVERFPQLYDKSNVKYKDRTAVENAWLFISGELQIPTADCISRWTSLRNRFSKERAKKTPSGSAAQTEWPLMKYLTFLHSVIKRRRTFGNIIESKSPWESQSYDLSEDNSTMSLIETNNSVECTNYEYLDETDIGLPNMEESFQPLSDFSNESLLTLNEQTRPTIFTSATEETIKFNTSASQRFITSNTLTPQRPTTPNTCTLPRSTTTNTLTPQRPTTPNTCTLPRSTTPNTLTPQRPTTPNTCTLPRSTTPNTLTPQRSTTPNTSQKALKISAPNFSRKRKQPLSVEEHLSDAVDVFKSFVTYKNTKNVEDESLKNFCDSLYGDLKNIDKKNLIACKIEIMQIISKYT